MGSLPLRTKAKIKLLDSIGTPQTDGPLNTAYDAAASMAASVKNTVKNWFTPAERTDSSAVEEGWTEKDNVGKEEEQGWTEEKASKAGGGRFRPNPSTEDNPQYPSTVKPFQPGVDDNDMKEITIESSGMKLERNDPKDYGDYAKDIAGKSPLFAKDTPYNPYGQGIIPDNNLVDRSGSGTNSLIKPTQAVAAGFLKERAQTAGRDAKLRRESAYNAWQRPTFNTRIPFNAVREAPDSVSAPNQESQSTIGLGLTRKKR